MIWIELTVCAALILLVGSLLSNYGEVIAERGGLGCGRVGVILILRTTSLPERLASFGMDITPLWWALDFGAGFEDNGTVIGSTLPSSLQRCQKRPAPPLPPRSGIVEGCR